MAQILLLVTVALVVGALVFGVAALATGRDPGLSPAEPDDSARSLPGSRPLLESDISTVRFDTAMRGYRMAQVDAALTRISYDLGYKQELIGALEAEVQALREGRVEDAEVLRKAREAAAGIGGEPDNTAPLDAATPPDVAPRDAALDESARRDAALDDTAQRDAALDDTAPPRVDDEPPLVDSGGEPKPAT